MNPVAKPMLKFEHPFIPVVALMDIQMDGQIKLVQRYSFANF
jgi:hypothetical protein